MTKQNEDSLNEQQYLLDEMQVGDSWRLFRILSEFVEGFDLLSSHGPMVSVFGASQANESNEYYKTAKELGAKLADADITVITGGGPGIMEAANKGAFEAGGESIGVEIDLPLEQKGNVFTNHSIRVRYFFVRKVMLIKYSQAFVIFPGGYGTLDEMFEALTLIRTKKILPFPIILVGSKYWEGALKWIRESVIANGFVDKEDLDQIQVTDDLDEVVRICEKSIEESIKSKWITKRRTRR